MVRVFEALDLVDGVDELPMVEKVFFLLPRHPHRRIFLLATRPLRRDHPDLVKDTSAVEVH